MTLVSTFRVRPITFGVGLLLLALGPFAGSAMAQGAAKPGTAAPVPATSAPAIAPVPAEPGTTTASFGDWVLRCQARWRRRCRAARLRGRPGDAGARPEGTDRADRHRPFGARRAAARHFGVVPDLSFPSSAQVVGDSTGPVLELPWRRCLPGGCFADAVAKDDLLKRWRGATEPGRIVVKSASGRDVAIPLSFRGLAPALDALAKERA